jgi:2-polyprenyl-3-methyl-5-hydroxy-6-metoxy-1,4-benzoquinol methylase
MHLAVLDQYETHPDPSPEVVAIGAAQLERVDDSLHYGWSWHRYRFCYRKAEGLRILDAGCGTALSTLGLARLNPGSRVVGVDASPRSLEIARERARASEASDIMFRQHDLEERLPAGAYDFVVCRRVLGQAGDPRQVLSNLAQVLDARGLLYVTMPSRVGRWAARHLRLAVESLCPAEANLAERAQAGLDLLRALRPEHPIRQYEAQHSGTSLPSPEVIIGRYLSVNEHDYGLAEAIRMVESAGLRFLYAATNRPWQPDRVLAPTVPDAFRARVARLADRELSLLIEALDPSMHGDEYRIYACLADFEPRLPAWPEQWRNEPQLIDRLIPHSTRLAGPARLELDPAAIRGRISYKAISGVVGELDARSDLAFRAIDNRRSCGEIDREIASGTGASEPSPGRQSRWVDLANLGFIVLESPDARQHVDCVHLGAVRHRLDCPCPRKWVRSCERYRFCTIDEIASTDAQAAAYAQALGQLRLEQATACAGCPDYQPDE